MSAATPTRRLRIVLLITEDWYFWTHRRGLAQALVAAGHEVVLATRVAEHGARIEALGVRLAPLRLRRTGRNPLRELAAIAEIWRLYRRESPDVVHHVGIKPMLYGSFAARLAGVPGVINALAGFGYVFTASGPGARALRACIELALRGAWSGRGTRVIFQNPETRDHFCARGLVTPDRSVLVRGTGVDLEEFSRRPEPAGEPVVMLAGRMLWDKGVGEAVEAVRRLRAAGLRLRLVLVGRRDVANPKSIDEAQLRRWEADGDAEWWGHCEDMPATLARSTLFVLPSYAEGLPRALVEAAATGRAIVTTDVAGCREVVHDGDNGLLVPARDAARLAEAIATLLDDGEMRARMAAAGRRLIEEQFAGPEIARRLVDVHEALAAP